MIIRWTTALNTALPGHARASFCHGSDSEHCIVEGPVVLNVRRERSERASNAPADLEGANQGVRAEHFTEPSWRRSPTGPFGGGSFGGECAP